MESAYILAFSIAIASFALLYFRRKSLGRESLPPSPPADSLLGHLRMATAKNPELVLHEWAQEFGKLTSRDIFHTKIFGQSMIMLNSVQTAIDLLEKRSLNYSSRPRCVIYELAGWASSLAFLRPGDRFKRQRKLYQQYFGKAKSRSYQPIQQDEARNLVKNLLGDPSDHDKYLRRFATSIVIRIAYGHQISFEDDSYNIMSHQVAAAVGALGPAGGTVVDFFPFLQYLPSWFPGTHFAVRARRVRKCIRDLHERPIEDVRQQMAAGIGSPCFVRNELENLSLKQAADSPDYDAQLDDIMGAAATIYSAGADTTWTTISIFVLAMLLHPNVQRKAQEEIDAVIASKRLPDFNDRGNLPYVNCVVQETMRWHPAVPLGIPHSTLEADIYNGMYIPKGALVFGNVWSMTHDPNVYHDPDTFDPSRFLPKPEGNGEPHPIGAFGFGRRICPGQHLAEASVWIGIATILSQLVISRAVDGNGMEVIPKLEFTSSITRYFFGPAILNHSNLTIANGSHPKQFECRIRARGRQ
ncbi:cytochrome P450 [Infundibulicybe gibba]|nr:cytochrome P450 [Infundibulicybe gibba]